VSFGFEFELLIPVFSIQTGPQGQHLTTKPIYREIPKPRAQSETTADPKIGVHDNPSFAVSVEHQDRLNRHQTGKWPRGEHMTSVEIATGVMDETVMSEAEVRQNVQAIADWAKQLHYAVIGGAQLIENCADHAVVPRTNYVGPAPGLENDDTLKPDAYIQETYGLRLDKVVDEFRRRTTLPDMPESLQNKTTDWYLPMKAACFSEPSGAISQALALCGDLGTSPAAAELRGLFALIRYYAAMLSNKPLNTFQSSLGKNALGVFYYKTQLSTVRNYLGQKYEQVDRFLDVEANRQGLCNHLIPNATWHPWGLSVLAGVSDSIFLSSMNPYSEELLAPVLGPEGNQSVGVVVENRQFRVTYPELGLYGLNTKSMYSPESWADIAVRLYRRLHQLHGG
jgi:hypothetical protein